MSSATDAQGLMLDKDPLWYKDAIIYELHVKAFYDGNSDGIGDFPGLIQKLDYLQDLGITCVWLLPFYPSPLKDDGYDISDYYRVHPSYGVLRDFRQFVREAHRRGLRVITELVVNHTSDQHPWFQAARRAPAGSSKRNFYVWSDTDQKYRQARIIFIDTENSNWTWDPVAKSYYWHRFFSHQPDLNYDNPHVRKAVLRTMRYWLDMGVDGLRLDAIPYLVEREGTNCENLPETHDVLKEFRAEIDRHYPDRLLLAEANQWPADVLPYFGDGDECHMAFHFPLMPRIFMAVRQEDRHPIVEIMRQTPDIPPECQWGLFLRNHDELTLEMVTDEERDYMYNEYAADAQARLNLGIRRRLAPLLGNSRRRIELLNSLLFSFPGTPFIYYGDEIGMGDNIYLGDRNGVRTPMQWSSDRNAGFSKTDFARLYLPPIMDPVYGYQSINVEAQQRDTSSLLHWMKRLIALRKRYKAFSRGTIEFLHPGNRKVLAYIRRYEEEIILAVANMSRFVQPVELDLAEFKGLTPVEPIGRVQFPPIGELPYFLTLGPHSFYWLQLERAAETIGVRGAPAVEEPAALPALKLPGDWTTLMEGRMRATLERVVLPGYLRRQRWFGAKARALETVSIRDWITLSGDPVPAFLTLVRVYFADGGSEMYLVPLALSLGPRGEELLASPGVAVLARVQGPDAEAALHDALIDDRVAARLLSAVEQHAEWRTQIGRIKAASTAALVEVRGDEDPTAHIRLGGVEQSNSSVFYGHRLFLKAFRRMEAGVNPDYEIGRFLTEQTQFDRIAKVAGAIEYHPPRGESCTLALLQQQINNQGTGWDYVLDELGRYFERAASNREAAGMLDVDRRTLLDHVQSEVPLPVLDMAGLAISAAGTLGKRTAELHLALASATEPPAFAPEPLTAADMAALGDKLRTKAREALALLGRKLETIEEPIRPVARLVAEEGEKLLGRVAPAEMDTSGVTKIRCHGDYHLGQVLWAENDFYIIDFEGEPARPLAERRAKESPLRDLAGMLRSWDYAAYAGLFDFTQDRPGDFALLEPWAKAWRNAVSAAFLRVYLETAGGASFLPADRRDLLRLLEAYLLDKALYEVQYELNNRPNWVRIPLMGIYEMVQPA